MKRGDVVYQGTSLFNIGEKNTELGYQIMLDGNYVDPMSVMDIKG